MSCIKKYDVAIDKTYVETLIIFDFDFYDLWSVLSKVLRFFRDVYFIHQPLLIGKCT